MTLRKPIFPEAAANDWQKPRRSSSDMDLDITPMIDVTFLLLIFFMVTSTMQATPDLDVPVAHYGVGVESRNATSVLVKKPAAANSDTPLIRAETAQGTTQELTLDELRRHVESQLAAGRPKVVIKADRDVSHGLVQRVVKVVTQVEGVEFAIGVRDAPAGGL